MGCCKSSQATVAPSQDSPGAAGLAEGERTEAWQADGSAPGSAVPGVKAKEQLDHTPAKDEPESINALDETVTPGKPASTEDDQENTIPKADETARATAPVEEAARSQETARVQAANQAAAVQEQEELRAREVEQEKLQAAAEEEQAAKIWVEQEKAKRKASAKRAEQEVERARVAEKAAAMRGMDLWAAKEQAAECMSPVPLVWPPDSPLLSAGMQTGGAARSIDTTVASDGAPDDAQDSVDGAVTAFTPILSPVSAGYLEMSPQNLEQLEEVSPLEQLEEVVEQLEECESPTTLADSAEIMEMESPEPVEALAIDCQKPAEATPRTELSNAYDQFKRADSPADSVAATQRVLEARASLSKSESKEDSAGTFSTEELSPVGEGASGTFQSHRPGLANIQTDFSVSGGRAGSIVGQQVADEESVIADCMGTVDVEASGDYGYVHSVVEASGEFGSEEPDKPAIVVDMGSSTIKAGFSGNCAPQAIFSTVIGYPKHSKLAGDEQEYFVGEQAQQMRGVLKLKYPIEHGIVTDFGSMEKIWKHLFENELHTNVEQDCFGVMLTEPVRNPNQNREQIAQLLFERFSAPRLFVAIQGVLALHSVGKATGMAVDCGDGATQVVPIWQGKSMMHAVQRIDLAGRELNEYMIRILSEKDVYLTSSGERECARTIKEQLGCVSMNFAEEVENCAERDFTMPDGSTLVLGNQLLRCPELLFQPALAGKEMPGLHELTMRAVTDCERDVRRELLENVVLVGGSSLFPNLPERLQAEIQHLAGDDEKVKVIASPDRLLSVWNGGSILASLSSFSNNWISKQSNADAWPPVVGYDEVGPRIVHHYHD